MEEALVILPYAGLKGEQIGEEIKTAVYTLFTAIIELY